MGTSYRKTIKTPSGTRYTYSKKGVSSSNTYKNGNSTTTISHRSNGKTYITYTNRTADGWSRKSVTNLNSTPRKKKSTYKSAYKSNRRKSFSNSSDFDLPESVYMVFGWFIIFVVCICLYGCAFGVVSK